MNACAVPGCQRAFYARGLCEPHYQRDRKGLALNTPIRANGLTLCERLLSHVEFDLVNGCWLWNGTVNEDGYGGVKIGDTQVLAHRASFQAFTGIGPGDHWVLHRCDTPPCINPGHLFLGDHQANVADRQAKGRSSGGSRRGEEHPGHRLTDADVERIRAMAASRVQPQRLIAAQYGITQGHVSDILNGKRRHAEEITQ